MTLFNTETAVANRALQHCGAARIAANALWTENSRNASEIRSCYHPLRVAELRRNTWRFSLRNCAIRPLGTASKFLTFGAWASGTTYAINDVVLGSDSQLYSSKVAANIGNDPAQHTFDKWTYYFGSDVAQAYDATVTYYAGELVYLTGFTTVYLSLISQNPDLPPTANWLTLSTQPTMAAANFIYPIGAGPVNQALTRNAFRLPAGFLRQVPNDPKQGSNMPLGAPSARAYDDYNFEGDYLTSFTPDVIVLRFAADVSDPNLFDPMFSEGFAARIGYEIVETLTQSASKQAGIAAAYQKFMMEARTVDGIERGPTEPPEDTYISCRG